jgi:hypothetical protein
MQFKITILAMLLAVAGLQADPVTYDFSGTLGKTLNSMGTPMDLLPTIGSSTAFTGTVTIDSVAGVFVSASNFTINCGGLTFTDVGPASYANGQNSGTIYSYIQPLVFSEGGWVNADDTILRIGNVADPAQISFLMDGAFYRDDMYYSTYFELDGTLDSFTAEVDPQLEQSFVISEQVPENAQTGIMLGTAFAVIIALRRREAPGLKSPVRGLLCSGHELQ